MKTTTVLTAAAVVATAAPRVVVDAFAVPAYTPAETIRVMDSPGTPSQMSSSTSTSTSSSSLLSSTALVDKELLKSLEAETKAAEKEARADRIKARREKNNEKYFEYEAKMAAETEARVRIINDCCYSRILRLHCAIFILHHVSLHGFDSTYADRGRREAGRGRRAVR